MTDYTRRVGTAGTITIRDTGSTVEYWISCSDPATNVGSYSWTGVVNGSAVGGSVNLPSGFRDKLLGSWPVSSSQTVTFHQNPTGTQGLGGAYDHSAYIDRYVPPVPGVPPAPTMRQPDPALITATGMRVQFDSNGDGGSPVTIWKLQRALDGLFTFGVDVRDSYGTTDYTDLTPATRYWFRAAGVNAIGQGPWSASVNAETDASVFVSDGAAWKPCPVNVSDGAAWRAAGVNVSDGAAWRPAG